MKIAIFENEFLNLKASFEAVNLIYFNKQLEYQIFPTAQEFGDLNKLNNYDATIIDIDLSPISVLDGYQLISTILSLKITNLKIIILTGHINIEEQLQRRNLPILPIITKPVTFASIKKALE